MGLVVAREEMKVKKKSCRRKTVQMYFGRVRIGNQEDKHVRNRKQKRPESHAPLLRTNNKPKEKRIGLLEREHSSRTTCKVSVVETTTHHKTTTVVLILTSGMIWVLVASSFRDILVDLAIDLPHL